MGQIIRFKDVRSLGFWLCLCVTVSGAYGASNSSHNPALEALLFEPVMIRFTEGFLIGEGYDVNDIEDIKHATTDAMSAIRVPALHVLTHRMRERAIPWLQSALKDIDPYVRATAARLLGVVGDLSGLEVMRRDLAELSKQEEGTEPAVTPAPSPSDKAWPPLRLENDRLRCALRAANVLAEFGDTSGYQLAAQLALKSTNPSLRTKSVSILAKLGSLDRTMLQARGCDPEAVLLAAAETETNAHTLHCISSSSAKMGPESHLRILEKLRRSPHVSDEHRRLIQSGIERTKRRLAEDKRKAEEQNVHERQM